SNPCDISEQAGKSRANNLFLSGYVLHYRGNFFGPGEGFARHAGKCSRRSNDSNHFAPAVANGSIPLRLIVSDARGEAKNSISRLEPSISFEPATTAAANTWTS